MGYFVVTMQMCEFEKAINQIRKLGRLKTVVIMRSTYLEVRG